MGLTFNEFYQAEFGKYPVDWDINNIGEVLSLLTDYHANGSYKKLKENVELLDEENYAIMIRTTNFEQGNFDKSGFKYITKKAYDFLGKTRVKYKDILMNKIANAGSVYLMPDLNKPVSLAMNLFLLRFNEEKVDQTYAFYFLKNYEQYVKTRATGSVTKTITKENVRNLEIAYPTLNEQKAIVSTLLSFDEKIQNNKKINEKLEELAQSIFKQWFIDFDFPNENGDPYKSSGGEMVDSEVGMIPKDWEVKELSELVKTYSGYSYKGKELGESVDAMVTIKNFDRNGGFKLSGLKEIIISEKVKPHHFVDKNDIIVAHTDLTQGAEIIGSPIILLTKGKYERLILSMDTVKVVPINGELTKSILYFLLKDYRFKQFALGYVTGTTVLHLSKKTIPKYKLGFPKDKQIINNLESILAPLLDKIANNINETDKLEKIRDVLLPKLMSGEIRVPFEN